MVNGVWKGVDPKVIGGSRQLLLNKFFDPNTPSMRIGSAGEKWLEKWKGKRIGPCVRIYQQCLDKF